MLEEDRTIETDGIREEGAVYRSFLLRVWRQHGGRVRASVEDVDTGEVTTFDELEGLCGWLEHRVDGLVLRREPSGSELRPAPPADEGR
jgi:hypothetical protein